LKKTHKQEAQIFSPEENIFARRNKFARRKTTAVIDFVDVALI
jgi:hypothetical protein